MTPQLSVVPNMSIEDIPYSGEAERAAIGSVLLDPALFDQLAGIVRESDFFLTRHKIIWQAFVDVVQAGGACDMLLVAEHLAAVKKLDDIGGRSYLVQLLSEVGTSVYGELYAQIVKRTATRRQLLDVADSIRSTALNADMPIADVLGKADSLLTDLLAERTESTSSPISELVSTALDTVSKNYVEFRQGKRQLLGIPFGWTDFDELLQGARSGKYYIIAARPRIGKSVMAIQAALNIALWERELANIEGRAARCVLIFPTEMSKTEVAGRLLGMLSEIPPVRHETGSLTQREMARFTEAAGMLSELNIEIDDTEILKPSIVRGKAQHHHARQGLAAVVVDGTYAMEPDRAYHSKYEEGAHIAISMKRMARALDVPVITTHQIGRDGDNRLPTLRDLNDSKGYEQFADVVVVLFRDIEKTPHWMQAEVLKQRQGAMGKVSLYFDAPLMKLRNMTQVQVDLNE